MAKTLTLAEQLRAAEAEERAARAAAKEPQDRIDAAVEKRMKLEELVRSERAIAAQKDAAARTVLLSSRPALRTLLADVEARARRAEDHYFIHRNPLDCRADFNAMTAAQGEVDRLAKMPAAGLAELDVAAERKRLRLDAQPTPTVERMQETHFVTGGAR